MAVTVFADCNDNLVNKTLIDVVRYGMIFNTFSFGMMQALVREMNSNQENISEVLKWLNIEVESNTKG